MGDPTVTAATSPLIVGGAASLTPEADGARALVLPEGMAHAQAEAYFSFMCLCLTCPPVPAMSICVITSYCHV